MTSRLLTTEERAALERRTPAAIHCERYRGEGPPAVRVGRRLLWPEDAWLAWIEGQRDEGRSCGGTGPVNGTTAAAAKRGGRRGSR